MPLSKALPPNYSSESTLSLQKYKIATVVGSSQLCLCVCATFNLPHSYMLQNLC